MKTLKELSELLNRQVESICLLLLPGGRRNGDYWVCGDLSGSEGKSLQVSLSGPFTGKWRDWAESSFRGDLIDLWREVKGLSAKQAIAEVRQFLGIAPPVQPMRKKEYGKPVDTHRDASPTGAIYAWFAEERKIEGPIVSRFQIKGAMKGHNGSAQAFVVFPCFSPEGEWVNSSYRGLKLGEDGKKKVFQDKDCAPGLFGWQALDKRAYVKRSVILTEGQIDAMTWTQWGFDALSIPNGNGTTWLDYEWENLEAFDELYLSFDMDGKTKDALQKVINRLGPHRCKIVQLPEKDANDCLKKGYTAEDAAKWIQEAKFPPVADFISMANLKDRLMDELFPKETAQKPIQLPLFRAPYPDDCFLIRPAEVTVWSGISSHGKTTFLTYLFVELAHAGEKGFICSLEQKPEKIAKKQLLSLMRTPNITPAHVEAFVESLAERTCFCDRIGYIEQNALFEMMEYAYRRFGVTQFLIDSLMRIMGLEENYPAQGEFLNKLQEFAKKYNVHIHVVVHPRKTEGDSKPSANDLKGSSLLRNNPDNIIIISRNVEKEKRRRDGEITDEEYDSLYDTKVEVDKDREEGRLKSFRYKFQCKYHYFEPLKASPSTTNSGNGESGQPPTASGSKSTSSFPRRKSNSR